MRDASSHSVRISLWMPFVTTATLLFLVVFAVAAYASDTTADLAGLFYLIAAPFLFRWMQSLVERVHGRARDRPDDPAEMGARS